MTWTGYGAAAYERLTAAVAEAKQSDPLRPVTVLVPTNVCGVVARRHLARGVGGQRGVAGLAVLTIDRLAERLATPALVGSGRRPATDAVLGAAWRQVLADGPGVFAPVAEHPATVRALVNAHRELRDVDESGLAAIEAGGGAVAQELVTLHRRVRERLRPAFYDTADLRAEAVSALSREPQRAAEIGAVVLFLPQDLRPGAVRLLTQLRSAVDVQVVAGTTGSPRADAAVVRTLHDLGVTAAPPPLDAPRAHRVLHASDADDEVRCVVRELMAALGDTPAHRIAVLYGSAAPYARLLSEQLAAAGLLRNGAGVRPTIERTLPRLLLDLLALPDHGWRRDEVMSVIARATVRTTEDRRLPAARWERLSREAGVMDGDDWERRLGRYASDLRAAAAAAAELPDANEGWLRYQEYQAADADALAGYVRVLRGHLAAGAGLHSWASLSAWGADALRLVGGDLGAVPYLPEEEARAAEKIERTLAGLGSLGALEESADLAALRGTLELELGDDLPRHGTFGQGILVAPLAESIGLDVDITFVVGLSDDLVPGRLDADALLPEEIRALAGGQLAPPRERIDRQQRQLLAALAAAPRGVASFARGDLRRSTLRLPSRWLLPSLRAAAGQATTGQTNVDASGWHRLPGDFLVGSASFAAGLATATQLATEQEWRTRSVAAGAALADDPVLDRALALLRARRSGALTRFDGDLTGHPVPSPIGDAITSPTALESWARCPHGYFMERLLGVRPLESPEAVLQIAAMDLGSIVHESLDEFHQAHPRVAPDQAWSAADHEQLRSIARAVAARYTARGLTGHPLLWERTLIRVLAQLDQLLDDDDRVRLETGRRQIRSELPFGMHGQPPVELTLPGGPVVRLRGSADRVDVTDDGIVVVDYKTGSTRSFEELSEENPTARGSKLQLPVYAKAARAALGTPTTPVAAEYWFVGENRHISVPLTEAVDHAFTRAVDVIVRGIAAGLFPHRPPPEDGYVYVACRYCDPDGLGAAEHRQRWSRKRSDPRLTEYLAVVEPDGASASEPRSRELRSTP